MNTYKEIAIPTSKKRIAAPLDAIFNVASLTKTNCHQAYLKAGEKLRPGFR